ncbi:MAG TPA: hypothetical protein VJN95_07895 [Gemmatimonadales bacterium]|nr:hypothetical protein [Gemmatimonadales bacterium]
MAKTETAIVQADVEEYLLKVSDFSFEMQVLHALIALGFKCQHSATYRDPVTNKARQFDIRAFRVNQRTNLTLVVECKNLRDTSPLLVQTTPRLGWESYHDLIVRKYEHLWYGSVHRMSAPHSVYQRLRPVGRQTDQVSRKQDGSFLTSDGPVYEKIAQSLNGAYELLTDAIARGNANMVVSVIPMLLVPADRLWVLEYNSEGTVARGPSVTDKVTLFVDHVWPLSHAHGTAPFSLSHLEIISLPALSARIDELAGSHGLFQSTAALLPTE